VVVTYGHTSSSFVSSFMKVHNFQRKGKLVSW